MPSSESPADRVHLRVASDARWLCVVRAAVERFAELAGFGARRARAITLAVDETCTNIIRHGYGGRTDGPIDIELWIDRCEGGRPRMNVRLRDHGAAVSVDALRPRPAPASPRPGGLGLRLIHEIMDSVQVESSDDGNNAVLLQADCPRTAASRTGHRPG